MGRLQIECTSESSAPISDWEERRKEKTGPFYFFPNTQFPPIADWTENAETFDYFAILLVGVYQAEFDMI